MSYTGFERYSVGELEVELMRIGHPAVDEYLRRIDAAVDAGLSNESDGKKLEESEFERLRACFARLDDELQGEKVRYGILQDRLEETRQCYGALQEKLTTTKNSLDKKTTLLNEARQELKALQQREADRPATW